MWLPPMLKYLIAVLFCILCSHCTGVLPVNDRDRVGISVMSSLTSPADMFITFIDGPVHRASHYAPYVGYNIYIYIYTYDTIYVLSSMGCNGWIYVYHGNMMYMAA